MTEFISVLAAVEAAAGCAGARCARSPDCGCAHCCGVGACVARKQSKRGSREKEHTMAFRVAELSIELVEALAPLMSRIKHAALPGLQVVRAQHGPVG